MDQRPLVIYQQSFVLHINDNKLSESGSNNILRPDSFQKLNTIDGVAQNL